MPKQERIYKDSRVELTPFSQKHYDSIINIASLGLYGSFIKKVIRSLNIKPEDKIIDLGCGTGRNACLMAKYLNQTGKITGLDISDIMKKHFDRKCRNYQNVNFIKQRIDQYFDLNEKYDKVFMSFVFHGFPNEIRKIIIQNTVNHLKKEGSLNILDYAEFDINSIPFHHRFIFNRAEGKCKYAYDYIKRDWKTILKDYGFDDFKEKYFGYNYVRLLTASF